tara:strand:+ start:1665 stop:2198 length:534 start_codon:yes stop_codon:yes gene_type:complete
MAEFENIKQNFEQYTEIIERFEDDNLKDLLEGIGERLAIAPANPQKDEYGCEDGGLLVSILNTLTMMRKLNAATGKQCEPKSLFKVALLHDIGRVGTLSEDLCLPQDSDWHYEKLGMHYKKNQSLYEFNSIQFTFQLLTAFGVKLTEEEYNAIQSVYLNKPLNHMGKLLLASRLLSN